jgi:CHAT domain-containing protein/tetratricopeptide (TPR) repeat protein
MLRRRQFRPPLSVLVAGFLLVVPLAVSAEESAEPAVRPAPSAEADSAARALLEAGDAAGALARYEREFHAAVASLPPEHPDLAVYHHRLGIVAWTMGDYERARTELEASLLLYGRAQGSDSTAVAEVLGHLGSIALEEGDAPRAVALHRRELAAAERARDAGPETALALDRLGTALAATGDVKGAEEAHARALSLFEEGKSSPRVIACLHHIAEDTRILGEPDLARGYLLRARSLSNRNDPEDPGVSVSVAGLAVLAAAEGDLDRARALDREVVAVRRRALGPEHPLLAEALVRYAASLIRTGHNLEAVDAALEAEAIRRDHLRFIARSLPERQALRYEARLASGLGAAVAAGIRTWDSTVVERIWDTVARSRALVLDEMASRHRWTDPLADSTTLALAAETARTRQCVAQLSVRGFEGMDPRAYRATLERLKESSRESERMLLARSGAAHLPGSRASAGLAEVRSSLPPGAGLVSLVRYLDPTAGMRRAGGAPPSVAGGPGGSEWSYAAFVTAGARAHARVIPLGDAEDLDSLVSAWRQAVADRRAPDSVAAASERRLGRVLRQRLWDPIVPHLEGVERVVLVPDGTFHLVNPMALRLDEDRFLLEEGPTFQIVSSERDLTGPARNATPGTGFLGLADPDFDAPRKTMSALDRKSGGDSRADENEDDVYRGSGACPEDSLPACWTSLPGSALEVEEVAKLWEAHGGGASVVLRGAAATEGSFKKLAPGKRALHLATHGFYAGACGAARENPLLRSGMALAGANSGRSEPGEPGGTSSSNGATDHADTSRIEDGILTADEISGMDLGGVEWAVLSGCETGVGVVRAGEGVLGLRRAFEVAGARTLVMSLWPVTDRAAREWTIRFYEGRLEKGLDPASAARHASRVMLEAARAAGEPAHPFAWAAFIVAGR